MIDSLCDAAPSSPIFSGVAEVIRAPQRITGIPA